MLSLSSVQLDAWIAFYCYPLARVLGLIATAPVFNNKATPIRVRLLLGIAITVALAPALPPMPAIAPGSGVGLAIMVQQTLIGIAMGFVMRLIFSAIDIAGDLIGLQMGLGFATFYDPQSAGQTAVVAEFFGLLATLMFLALNGHLVMLAILAQSFTQLPVSEILLMPGWHSLVRWAAALFSVGLLLAMPLIAALLITNIALGVLTRAAPQLNLFAVGFPVTLTVGFIMLLLSLPYLAPSFERVFSQGLEAMTSVLPALAPK